MKIEVTEGNRCHDCPQEADPSFTMDYTDIGEGYIYWCSSCGPRAHAIDKALTEFLMKSPENVKKAQELLDAMGPCTHEPKKN